ncbi:Uncharacterized protein TCM_016423 [Theobroma cacao]|uniref:Uncharacterized protein n=1 Tax=Theobroma cacao TaxID=3641 RepID=A0A061G536_THECC|nr:Uncharacterized protein TCM_016423 [Theobroma cacao]
MIEGFIKGVFSSPIGIGDSNYAQFLTIKKGLSLFPSSPWTSNFPIVENDSKNAISWVLNLSFASWRMKNIYSNL